MSICWPIIPNIIIIFFFSSFYSVRVCICVFCVCRCDLHVNGVLTPVIDPP